MRLKLHCSFREHKRKTHWAQLYVIEWNCAILLAECKRQTETNCVRLKLCCSFREYKRKTHWPQYPYFWRLGRPWTCGRTRAGLGRASGASSATIVERVHRASAPPPLRCSLSARLQATPDTHEHTPDQPITHPPRVLSNRTHTETVKGCVTQSGGQEARTAIWTACVNTTSVNTHLNSICVNNTPQHYMCYWTPTSTLHVEYSKTSLTDHLHRATTSLYQPLYLVPKWWPTQYYKNNILTP